MESEGAIEQTWTAITYNLNINPQDKCSTEGSCPTVRKPVVLSHIRQGSGFADFMLEQDRAAREAFLNWNCWVPEKLF